MQKQTHFLRRHLESQLSEITKRSQITVENVELSFLEKPPKANSAVILLW
jgi:hypothetical protein